MGCSFIGWGMFKRWGFVGVGHVHGGVQGGRCSRVWVMSKNGGFVRREYPLGGGFMGLGWGCLDRHIHECYGFLDTLLSGIDGRRSNPRLKTFKLLCIYIQA